MRDKTKFAERLRIVMKENKISQYKLAEELGITQGSVGQWCRALTTPTPARIGRIAEILGCSKEWLSGEDVPKDKEIKRNASGYTDPTAYAAIKQTEKEGKEMLEVRGIEKTIEKGGIYEYTLQNGSRKYALCMSDDRRNDSKSVAIFVLTETEYGHEVYVNGTPLYINPNRLSYGFVDNFGKFVTRISDKMMQDIEKAIVAAIGLQTQATGYIANEDAEKIKRMVKALKDENEEKEKCIEKLHIQIQMLSAECNKLASGVPNEMHNAELMKAHIERDLFKNLYEETLAKLLER
jgi:transcriptional regulator with XRE-family HTH domain